MFLAGMEMLVQMRKKMIEFLISGYEYYENERKRVDRYKIQNRQKVEVWYLKQQEINQIQSSCFSIQWE